MSREFWISTAIAVALAIVTSAVAWYQGWKSDRRRQPTWFTATLNELTRYVSRIKGLEVVYQYKGQSISQLSRTNVSLWNAGSLDMRQSEFMPNEPLTLTILHGYRLLDVIPLQNTDPANGFDVKQCDDKTATITLAHLRAKRGVVMQVIHTGRTDADVHVDGDFYDSDKLRRIALASGRNFNDKDPNYKLIGSKASRVDTQMRALTGALVALSFIAGVLFLVIRQIMFVVKEIVRHNFHWEWTPFIVGLVAVLVIFVSILSIRRSAGLVSDVGSIPLDLDPFQGIISSLRDTQKAIQASIN